MSKLQELIDELCPHGVEYRELGEICVSLKKGTLKTSDLIEDGKYPVINSGRGFYGYYNNYNNKNALTFAARGEYAGFVNYIKNEFWAGGLCYPYSSKNEKTILNKFIYYFLKSDEERIMKNLVAKGSIPALNKRDVDKIKIPLPPMPVQEEIVRILDKFSALNEDLINNLSRELELRRKQYAYYRDKLLSFDGEDVEWVALGEVCEKPAYGSTAKAVDGNPNTDYRYIRITDIVSGNSLGDDWKTASEFSDKYVLKDGDILFARSGATVGKNLLYNHEMGKTIYAGYLIKFKPITTKVLPSYVYHCVNTSRYWSWVESFSAVSAQPNINAQKYSGFKIPLPLLPEQKRIAGILDKFDALVNSLTAGIPAEINARQKQYEYYRDKLLSFEELQV